jgi:radical SAM protein with 4Fe4S-binding SPASM domain
MSLAQIKNLVDQATGLGAQRIYFTGGEPFLREDILDLIEYVTAGTQLVILSNGTLINANISQKLGEISNNNLIMQVSLEGPNAKVNDQIRGTGSFKKAIAGINELVRVGLVPIVTTTVTKLNADYVTETTSYLASLGVKDHHILWLHPRGRGQTNLKNLSVSPGQLTEIMRALFKNSQELGMQVDNKESLKVRVQARRGRKNDLCNSCFEMLCVDSDLQVYPCASLNGDDRFSCGSLENRTLEQVWLDSPVAQWIRDNSVQKKVGCNDCYLKFFCGGGCFCQAYYNYKVEKGFGCIMAPDPYCESYKDLLEDLLWELAKVNNTANGNGNRQPELYASMDAELPACAVSGIKVTDAAFEVAGFHCACVLGVE